MRLLEIIADETPEPDARVLNNEFMDANTAAQIKAILKKYHAEKVMFPGTAEDPVYLIGDNVVEFDGNYANAEHVYRWLYDVDVFDYYPNYEVQWNQEFWQHPPPLYHGTPRANLDEILRHGLQQQNATRGMSNRHVGMAVFTTMSQEFARSGSYGDTVIVIDTQALAASGKPPFATREPDVVRDDLRGALAHHLGRQDFEPEIEGGIDPDTVVLYGEIPAVYLSVDQ